MGKVIDDNRPWLFRNGEWYLPMEFVWTVGELSRRDLLVGGSIRLTKKVRLQTCIIKHKNIKRIIDHKDSNLVDVTRREQSKRKFDTLSIVNRHLRSKCCCRFRGARRCRSSRCAWGKWSEWYTEHQHKNRSDFPRMHMLPFFSYSFNDATDCVEPNHCRLAWG